jgi:predicted RNA methylase
VTCTIFIARYRGVAAAGIWLTRFAGTVTFKLAGWDASSSAPPHANDALHWAAIQWARTNGDRTYDLRGFDRRGAECLVSCRPMPDGFHHSPGFYKLALAGRRCCFRARDSSSCPSLPILYWAGQLSACLPARAGGDWRNASATDGFRACIRLGGCGLFEKDFLVSLREFWGFARIVRPAYLGAGRAAARFFDRKFGITTTDEDVVREIGRALDHNWCYGYRAVSYLGIGRLMRKLEPSQTDALLDMGCGAGRAICVAAQYPFSRVIGIEIDEGLCALAERNARRLRRYAVRPEIVCADAAKYRVPDDITVVFLYSSFGGEVLKAALTRVLESFDRAPRRMQLAYANPREPELIASMPRYRTADKISLSWRPGTEWHRTKMVQFYEVEPQG